MILGCKSEHLTLLFWHPGAYGGWDEKAVSVHKEQTDRLGIAVREKGE